MNVRRLLPVLSVLALLSACSRENVRPHAELPVLKVQAGVVHTAALPVQNELNGTVRPVQYATLASKWMGVIEELPVALGQRVQSGDVLVRLSAAEIEARVSQSQVALAQAKRELKRERDLQNKGAATEDLVRSLEERLAGAEAQVLEAQALRDYTTLRAPFAGLVARKFALPGDLASPGQPLLQIEGDKDFEIELGLPDSLRGDLIVGAVLRVTVPSSGLVFSATLKELSSSADTQVRSITAKLAVPAEAVVYSGQYVRVLVPYSMTKVRLVPVSSISLLGQMQRVFTVQEGRARLRLVRLGAVQGEFVEVMAGLNEGETVLLSPPLNLRDGQLVEVQK